MEFAISQSKMIRLPSNKKQTYWLNSGPQMWPLDLTLTMILTLKFSRSNMEFAISRPKMVWLPQNEKQTYRLNFRPLMWPSGLTLAMSLTLNFQGQIWNLLYLNQKRSDYHETKSKHIEWTLGLKCDQWFWPWIFEFSRSNVTWTFDHTHGVDLGFSWSNF